MTHPAIVLHPATRADIPQILAFISDLAEYEKLAHEAVATEAQLDKHLFGERPYAEVVIAEVGEPDGSRQPAGFALFFHNFSTFTGQPGIYLEDLFVRPQYRGLGVGKRLIAELARIAVERNCTRLEWSVLDWNEPAIRFYRSLGARPQDEWTVQRVTGDALRALAAKAP
jgi:GNAT superfamily N-acetyltransferase